MSTLTEAPILVPPPAPVTDATAGLEAKLDRVLRLIDDQAQHRADLAEAVDDLMPMANGLARLAIARLDALERDGTLALATRAGRAAATPEVLALATRACEALRTPAPPVRLLGLVRALREPSVARGLGVALALLRALGAEASNEPPAAPAAA